MANVMNANRCYPPYVELAVTLIRLLISPWYGFPFVHISSHDAEQLDGRIADELAARHRADAIFSALAEIVGEWL